MTSIIQKWMIIDDMSHSIERDTHIIIQKWMTLNGEYIVIHKQMNLYGQFLSMDIWSRTIHVPGVYMYIVHECPLLQLITIFGSGSLNLFIKGKLLACVL